MEYVGVGFICANYIKYDIWFDLLFGITQCYIYLLYISYFTNNC